MSIVSVNLHWKSQQGSDSVSTGVDNRNFVDVYRVEVDSKTDDQTLILAASGVPQYGDNKDGVPLKSRLCQRDQADQTRLLWNVTCRYTNNKDANEPTDADGNPTDDPTEDRGSVSVRHITKRVPITSALYVGLVDAEGDDIAGKDPPFWNRENTYPIMNAAGVPTFPFPEIDKPIQVVRTVSTWATWDTTWSAFYNKVNDAEETITWFLGAQGNHVFGPYAKRTLLCNDVAAEDFEWNNEIFYHRIVEFHYDPDGWYEDRANRGKQSRILAGEDEKPDGSTYSMSDLVNAHFSKASVINGKDMDGEHLVEEVWLDEDGHPIKDFAPTDAIFIRWLTREETDFTTIISIVG